MNNQPFLVLQQIVCSHTPVITAPSYIPLPYSYHLQVVSRVQESWVEEKLAGILLMDDKGAFVHVIRNYLLRTMESIALDDNIMLWTE